MDRIVVGLGNPGSRYEGTRHNVGWMVVDRLAERAGSAGYARARDGAASVRVRVDELELLLAKPTTYMNLSGTAVRAVLARERVPLRDVLVVVDDFALPFGRLRIRDRGSDGGHNGLRSIIGELGTQGFARLRVGIGEPARGTARHHVLAEFASAERAQLDRVLDAAADCVMDWARSGPEHAAARWNGWRFETEAAPGEGEGTDAVPSPSSAPPHSSRSRPPRQDGPAIPEPAPDAAGVLRTATGWRRLLHRPAHDHGKADE